MNIKQTATAWTPRATRYAVFDCHEGEGCAFIVKHEWAARLLATVVSKITGRTHDYERHDV